jgi:hypothetical protein
MTETDDLITRFLALDARDREIAFSRLIESLDKGELGRLLNSLPSGLWVRLYDTCHHVEQGGYSE